MTTVFLRGGLGNQMFQYAFGVAMAERTGRELRLDLVSLNDRFPRKEFTYRTFDMDIFGFEPRFTPLSIASQRVPIPGVWLGLDLASIYTRSALGAATLVKENSDEQFDPGVFGAKGDTILWGRWQSEKYFKPVEKKIWSAFTFKHPLEGEAKTIAEKIRSTSSISLHVRRGDYLSWKSMHTLMGDTNLEYYNAAIKFIRERVPHPEFFVFSDDIAWCQKNIKMDLPVTYVSDGSAGPKDAYHLELMSLCKYNIIANSTFSWWGAWLNQNQGKIVVAPRQWYGDGRKADDIIPESWIKL